MKKTLQIVIVFGLIILTSCDNNNENREIGFEYIIQGSVTNGDSTSISLYIPSNGLDKKQTTGIHNEEYQFKGFAKNFESAYIKFENDIINPGDVSCLMHLFIEKDTVELNFAIDSVEFGLCFKDKIFLNGDNNLFFSEKQNKLSKNPIYTFSDPYLMDSMHRYVYPAIKKDILINYERLFHKNEHHIVSLYYLEYMVNNLREVFDSNYLTDEEKKKLQLFLAGINVSLNNTKTYKYVENSIANLIDNNEFVFKDFTLINHHDDSISISEIIPKNEVTIIYFWWSMCSPCREFIKNTQPEYVRLKEKNIEIISINTDQSQNLWKSISKKDSINWMNLYSGDNSEIAAYYGVTYFPRILIFDKEFNLISEKYEDLEILLKK